MTRKYSLVIEGDSASGYSAYIPELPTIVVTGHSHQELSERATSAVRLYWESLDLHRCPPGSVLTEIEVEIPA